MSNSKVQVGSHGISFAGLLFIVFLILKLGVGNTAVQGWSWWWVTAPLWGGIAILFGISIVVFVIVLIVAIITKLGG